MDANTLRMHYEGHTMDFTFKKHYSLDEVVVTTTGNMISDLVDEFAGRTLTE